MSCRAYQFLIGTEPPETLRQDLKLQAHLRTCGDCAQLYEEMQGLARATAAMQPLAAPDDFSRRVRLQVRETRQVRTVGLFERILGPLRAPAPALQPAQLMAGAAVVLVAVVLIALVLQPLGAPGANPALQVPSVTQPGGGQPIYYAEPEPTPARQPQSPPNAP